MTLDSLTRGQRCEILNIAGPDALRQRLATLGVLRGQSIQLAAVSPWGNPRVYRLGRQQICLRNEEAVYITVTDQGNGR
ncbi:FeoA family protein [Neptunomonas qingdaonensis]|uniref:Ferrous iron transport protein A n=1 Tax=Neptunomonas qingdaonensis TaxID=1045558 RepID=A0A1I2VJU6_9GAMM|nr:FeoA family protein [Neptunomonas qingdaonensis]SFG89383.1 ferrous iron transport protein A [Neptunomonas qingdaonensis]